MTLDQLETFVAIAKEGGLRAASKVLHKTQPTLSSGIKNLEEELGILLLDRSSYRVKLTEEGSSLYQKAQDILAQLEQFKIMAREYSMGREPKLSLAIDYLCPLQVLLKVLSKFAQSSSQTKLEMDFEVLAGSEDKLVNHEANIAITPFISMHSKIEFKKICEVKILPVTIKEVVGSARPSLKKFLELPQIVVRDSTKKSPALNFGSHTDSKKWVVSDHMIKRELILNGFGWGHLEQTSIEEELDSQKLIELKVSGLKSSKLPLYMVRSMSKPFGPAAQELWDFIFEQFKDV